MKGLRSDKVVIRLMERLRTTLRPSVPAGTTVIVTVTAPVRQWSTTAAAVEDRILALLARRAVRDAKATINRNRVGIRIVRGKSRRAPKLIGFVHNPDVDSVMLLDLARERLQRSTARAASRKRSR